MSERRMTNINGSGLPIFDLKRRYVGKCKWFNVLKGFGFINADDINDEDLFIHQSQLKMEGFRSLEEGERVSFSVRFRKEGKGYEAYEVGPEDSEKQLLGSSIRPIGKKKDNLIRCFKCGKFGTHLAQRCKKVDGNGKLCYSCGSGDHLFNLCPQRSRKNDQTNELGIQTRIPTAVK